MVVRLPGTRLAAAVALLLLVAPLAAEAEQRAGRVPRIGRLGAGPPPSGPNPPLEAFRQGMRELGYIEGQNLVIEQRYAELPVEQPTRFELVINLKSPAT
jgi:putative ABC transport system substrate-binding protein